QARGLFWNERIQSLVIKRLLDGLTLTAEHFYKEGQSLNALVVIDEAHRLAPRELARDDDAAREVPAVLSKGSGVDATAPAPLPIRSLDLGGNGPPSGPAGGITAPGLLTTADCDTACETAGAATTTGGASLT